MPITKSAKKALRHSIKRAKINRIVSSAVKAAIRDVKRGSAKSLDEVARQLDRAAKKGVIHKGKAARLKSRLAKRLKLQKPQASKKTTKRKK